MKKILLVMGLGLMLTALCSCSDDNTSPANTPEPVVTQTADYNYFVRIASGVSSRMMVIDSITGNVSDVVCSESWLTAKQDGQDGEQHPVMRLTIPEESNVDRTATVSFTSTDNKQVSITVAKQRVLGSNDGEILLPEVTPRNKAFYQDWYKGAGGLVYITETNDSQTWRSRALPWANNALGAVPAYVAEEMERTKADWRLVYSTLGLESTSGANFFTLYNDKQGKLRFFYYIPTGEISMASTAYFILELHNPSGRMSLAFNGNESKQMPIAVQNSGKVTVTNNYDPTGGTQTLYLMPIGTGPTRSVTTGWACFDIAADGGYMDRAKEALEDPNTRITLRLATTLAGNIDLIADLKNTGTLDMSGVSLVKKGSSLAAAATFFNGFGTSMFQIGGGITNIAEDKKGAAQIIGGVSTLVGTCLNTAAATKDSKQSFTGTAQIDFDTKGTIEGTVKFDIINSVPAITFRPDNFKYKWETLLSAHPEKWADGSSTRGQRAGDSSLPTYGLMNLTGNPVVYISADHLLYSPAEYPASYELSYDKQLIECVTKDDEQLRYISFLDPSTLEVYLNKEMMGFDFDRAEISTCLVANAGPYDVYTGPDAYYGYYQLQNDQILLSTQEDGFINLFSEQDTKSAKLVACRNSDIPTITKDPDLDASYEVSELSCDDNSVDTQEEGFNYRYYGLTGSMFNGARKIVVDPVIYVPTNKDHTYIYNKSCLGPLYVVVFVRLIKGNTMQIISKHFVPEVRTFKGSEIATIKNRINRSSLTQAKTSQGTVAAEYVDTEWLKSRALKMLELAGN